MHSSWEQGELVPALQASRQPREKCAQDPREEPTELSWLTHTHNSSSSSSQGMLKVRKEFKTGMNKLEMGGDEQNCSHFCLCSRAGERVTEQGSRELALTPVPALLTPASSFPKSPDGALGTPQCSLAANQTHTPLLSPALGCVSESRTLLSPVECQSQCHGHYLLLRMQVSSLPSSS